MHASLADIIADVTANSIEARAKRIEVDILEDDACIRLIVRDNGKGISKEILARVFDPFYTEPGKHEKRKIGMGLPFVKQTCDMCGGEVELQSELGVGTTLSCSFDAKNIDTPPMGNLAKTVLGLFNYPGEFELVFTHKKRGEEYSIARTELADAVGGFDSVEGLSLAKDFLESQESAL